MKKMKKKITKHIDLKNIKNPDFLKDLSIPELEVLSEDIRKYLVEVTSKTGGHLSANLGVVEATIALCKVFNFKNDKIIFDVGHQCYTYKLLTGRNLETLRCKDGVSGFQKINESLYDHYEAGHSSTSISAGLGMAIARDLNHEHYNVISFIGDSSIVSGLAFEAINNAGQEKHKQIIVLNDNDMSISPSVGGLSKIFRNFQTSSLYRRSAKTYRRVMTKYGFTRWFFTATLKFKNFIKRKLIRMTIFDYAGFTVLGPIDGHNFHQLIHTLEKAKRNDKSTIIMIKTTKGKGYKYAEEDSVGKWHGVGKFNPATGEIYSNGKTSWSSYFASLVKEQLSRDKKSICIVPGTALGSDLAPLFNEFPDRMIDVGIAEEHALILASGLSISGYHPIISIYSTFLQRGYDELSHDLARMNLPATLLIDRSGLVGSDGETHQGIYDVSFLTSIPNVIIATPSNDKYANKLFEESFKQHSPFAIRYPRASVNQGEESYQGFGKWVKESNGNKVALITYGPVVEELKGIINNKDVSLFNALYQKPLDIDSLKEACKFNKIVIYDRYGTETGFAALVSEALTNLSYKGEVVIKAIPDQFIKQATIDEQLEMLGLTNNDILKILK